MQPHRPVPPEPPRPDEDSTPAGAVKPESPSPEPSAQNIDLAAMLKKAKARLAETEKKIKLAAESRTKAPSATKGTHAPKPEVQQPAAEPQTDVAAKNTETYPVEPEAQPPVEPTVDPATAASDTEARPAEPEAQPPNEPDANLVAALKDTEARLAETEKRAAEHHDALLRAKAETENVRRRAQEDISKASKFAAEKFAVAMLPVKDSLEAALIIDGQTLKSLREGVELTLKQLVAAFDGAKLTEENPLGQKFDPNKHQAIGVVESEAEPNTVINVLQKGYLLHERVIRPAMVMVSKAKT